MNEILKDRALRRMFFIVFLLVLVVLFGLRLLAFGGIDWHQFAPEMLDKTGASLIVTVLLGVFVFYVTPHVHHQPEISILEPQAIRPRLLANLATAERYKFKGSTGRFIRSKVIP